jgi:branched-chain amino acid transport system ATP-binding protein
VPDQLVLRDVIGGYGKAQILNGVTLAAQGGRLTTVIGPNGSGKSTAMRCAAGLLTITSGSVLLNDEDLTTAGIAERVSRGISFVPQERSLFPTMSVKDNITLGSWTRRRSKAARQAIDAAYESFPQVRQWANQTAGALSGGQQRVVELARALVSEPKILVLDEPTAGVAPAQVAEIMSHLRILVDERRVGILLVEQNVPEAIAVSDYVYGLVNGTNDIEGPAAELGADLEGLVRRWLVGSEPAS